MVATVRMYILENIYSKRVTKILRNLHLTFDHSTHSQKLGEDVTKLYGLLRIYKLEHKILTWDHPFKTSANFHDF